VYVLSTQIVEFTRVRYVPRQVYSVNLLTMDEIEKMMQKEEQAPAAQPAEERKADENVMQQPPEEPKPQKKPVKKKEPVKQKKQVPSSEVTNSGNDTAQRESLSAGGSKQGSTGDMNLDVSNFPFGYYLVTIRRKIAGNWSVPATQATEEMFCRIYFKIARSGQIVSPDIEQSSGSFVFDQAALRAVIQASPLPPLPGEFRDQYLGVHFNFAYEEK
jgi:TonB family protein